MALNNCDKILADALYVHIPFCTAKCPYCGFYSEPVEKHNVAELLEAEIAQLRLFPLKCPPETIYIGGGSPSCIGPEALCGFIEKIIAVTGRPKEFTVEINPGQTDETFLKELHSVGVNRLSVGAQSFSQEDLDFLGRNYSVKTVKQTVENAKKIGFNNINLDMIFAVPGSNINRWQQSLNEAIELGPQHISAYSLTYEHGTKLNNFRMKGEIEPVSEELDRDMYYLAVDVLNGAGIEQYEISNFARKSFQCKGNLTYWENEPYVGIGPAAASYFAGQRRTNFADIKKYVSAIRSGENTSQENHVSNPREIVCETAVLNLRLISGINLEKFKTKTGFDPEQLFAEPIQKYTEQGLLKINSGHLSLTKQALAIADTVLCEFALP